MKYGRGFEISGDFKNTFVIVICYLLSIFVLLGCISMDFELSFF